MTTQHARNPQATAAAASATQIERYQVTVTAIDLSKVGQANTDPRGIATTLDNFGKYRQIGVSTVVGSGAYPQVGELWVVDKSLGSWTFCSRQQPVLPVVSDSYTLAQGLQQVGFVTIDPAWLPPVSPTPFPPPPVTTGSTLQTTVDHLGDVWIAKNGVFGGAWKRANQMIARAALGNAGVPSGLTYLPITLPATIDPWGVLSATAFTCVLAGTYHITAHINVNGVPAANGPAYRIQKNAVDQVVVNFYATTSYNYQYALTDTIALVVGDVIRFAIGNTGGTATSGAMAVARIAN